MFLRKPHHGNPARMGMQCLCHQPGIAALSHRMATDMSRRSFMGAMAAAIAGMAMPKWASAQPVPQRPSAGVLFTNFRLFDGQSATLREGLHLLVDANRIKTLGTGTPVAPQGAQTIDCGGKVLMPGLIDMHWHTMFVGVSLPVLLSADLGYLYLAASAQAERALMRGFTTVRDLGGPSFALKQAIDDGLVNGPRIYPCGAMITTSGGHGDMRMLSDLPRDGGRLSSSEKVGGNIIADSADEVRMRVREQFIQGASQIKLVGSGGVSSPRSPLEMTTYTEAQLRAGVETAADWGTYVAVHAYTPTAIQRAVAAGAQCIEHGHLMDEASAKMMAGQGVWLSTQPFVGDDDFVPLTGPSRERQLQVMAGTDQTYRLAKKYKIKTAFGSDLLFSPQVTERQGVMLTHLLRWYTAAEALTMATATNAELLSLSGSRNPYAGKLGVLEEGAFADLLLVNGNPLENLALLENPQENLLVIMKDGRIHKDARKTRTQV